MELRAATLEAQLARAHDRIAELEEELDRRDRRLRRMRSRYEEILRKRDCDDDVVFSW